MNKTVKILLIVGCFLVFLMLICGGFAYIGSKISPTPVAEIPTHIPTSTLQPTYTPYPTLTPYPTPTAYPTPVPTKEIVVPPTPTDVPYNTPENIYANIPAPDGVKEANCPEGDNPPGAESAECFTLENKGLGVIYFDYSGNIWGIAAAWFGEDNLAYVSGTFLAWAGMTHGWNGDDIVGAIKSIQSPDTWYSFGSVKASITQEDDKIAIMLKPIN